MPEPSPEDTQKAKNRNCINSRENLTSEGRMSINTRETSSQKVIFRRFKSQVQKPWRGQRLSRRAPGCISEAFWVAFGCLAGGKTIGKKGKLKEVKTARANEQKEATNDERRNKNEQANKHTRKQDNHITYNTDRKCRQ